MGQEACKLTRMQESHPETNPIAKSTFLDAFRTFGISSIVTPEHLLAIITPSADEASW